MDNSNLETFRKRSRYNLIAIPAILITLLILLNGILSNAYTWASSNDPEVQSKLLLSGGMSFLGILILLGLSILYFIWLTGGRSFQFLGVKDGDPRGNIGFPLNLPRRRRLTTLFYVLPIFAILDIAFGVVVVSLFQASRILLSEAVGVAYIASVLLVGIFLLLSILVLIYIEIGYIHWIITKNWPRKFSDLRNWSARP